jgi:hypothetical protein
MHILLPSTTAEISTHSDSGQTPIHTEIASASMAVGDFNPSFPLELCCMKVKRKSLLIFP